MEVDHLPVGTKVHICGFWADHYINKKGCPEFFEILGYSYFEGTLFYHGMKDDGDTFEIQYAQVEKVI